MADYLDHECGVAAVVLKKPITEYPAGGALHYVRLMLKELQNRGQETCGFATFNPERKTKKLDRMVGIGLVDDVFVARIPEAHEKIMRSYAGDRAIGHVRYATSGDSKTEKDWLDEGQPFPINHGNPDERGYLGYNGNMANNSEIRCSLYQDHGIEPETQVDTELLAYLIANNIETVYKDNGKVDFVEVMRRTQKQFDGGLSLVFLNGRGHIFAYRGIPAIMPLCYGENDKLFAVASETSALSRIGIRDFNFFQPGELISYNSESTHHLFDNEKKKALCHFQWIYFARATSILDKIGCNEARERFGERLALEEKLRSKIDGSYVVVPVPDTSIPAARAMARGLEIMCEEPLIKNDHTGRTFIVKGERRKILMAEKFSFIPGKVEGRKIILVDDSIVRGSTLRSLVNYVREVLKPSEVHVRSTCPPIRFPCFYGVDFPTREELAASKYDDNEELERALAEEFGADSVQYLSTDGLHKVFESFDIPRSDLCTACLTGKYPTPAGQRRLQELLDSKQ